MNWSPVVPMHRSPTSTSSIETFANIHHFIIKESPDERMAKEGKKCLKKVERMVARCHLACKLSQESICVLIYFHCFLKRTEIRNRSSQSRILVVYSGALAVLGLLNPGFGLILWFWLTIQEENEDNESFSRGYKSMLPLHSVTFTGGFTCPNVVVALPLNGFKLSFQFTIPQS